MGKKKAQLWYMDLVVAITLFTLSLVLAFIFITNTHIIPGKQTNAAIVDADKLSASLMTPGIPANWTEEYVVSIGLTSINNILNVTKVDRLKNMTINDYSNAKYILGLKSDFLIYFENNNGDLINITTQTFVGKPGYSSDYLETLELKDLVTVTRYLINRENQVSEIIGMVILVWQE